MLKIAVSGKMAAGKTTLTNIIQQHHEMQQPQDDSFFEDISMVREQLLKMVSTYSAENDDNDDNNDDNNDEVYLE